MRACATRRQYRIVPTSNTGIPRNCILGAYYEDFNGRSGSPIEIPTVARRGKTTRTSDVDSDIVDTVVIGAGVIGLAVARALSYQYLHQDQQRDILVLDRGSTIGNATSSRNSEVIHAGLYYPPNTIKAQTCVRGKQLLYDYCNKFHIAYRQCGKLIVATQKEHFRDLRQLQHQAMENGVLDTQILDTTDQVRQLEPNLFSWSTSTSSKCILGALWSPSTGIFDSHSYMQQLQSDAESNGNCTIVLRTSVDDAQVEFRDSQSKQYVHRGGGSTTHTLNQPRIHLFAGGSWISCRWVINCAGLWATQVARQLHRPIAHRHTWQPPQQYYARGTYFRLQSYSSLPSFSHLIYPIPDPNGGLGVHLTMDYQQQQVKFGPDVEWVDPNVDDPDTIDLNPNPDRAAQFYESIRTYWPDLPNDALISDYVGIRPKLSHPSLHDPKKASLPFQDFVIAGPETHNIPGIVHLFGIESPGLTSSMSIADFVANKIAQ